MENLPPAVATHEEACLRVAARFGSRWLQGYVSGKLRSDPLFPAAFALLRDSSEPLLDVGCGVGLLAFYLRERGCEIPILGLDLDAPKVAQGNAVARAHYQGIELREHNVITEELPDFRGNVALFDVLHYLPPAAQQTLLQTLARAVLPGGMFLLRDAPRDGSARFWLTYAGELFAQTIRWNVGVPLHFATRASIAAAFPPEDWIHHEQPAWGGTPFNNRLFTFRRRPA